MRVGGKERRRRGPVSTARRALYGLLLWLCHDSATAADHVAAKPARRPLNIKVSIASLGSDPAGASEFYRITAASDDPRLSAPFNGIIHALRFRTSFDELRELRNGLGLDFELPDAGKLHLSLHPKRNEMNSGKRWSLGSSDADSPGQGLWSIGGTLDVVQTETFGPNPERHRRLVFAPQLMLDGQRALGLPGKAVLILQHANWQSPGHPATDEPVWQVRLSWKF